MPKGGGWEREEGWRSQLRKHAGQESIHGWFHREFALPDRYQSPQEPPRRRGPLGQPFVDVMAPGGTVKTSCGKGERDSESHTLLILIFVVDISCVTSSVSASRPCFWYPGNFGD